MLSADAKKLSSHSLHSGALLAYFVVLALVVISESHPMFLLGFMLLFFAAFCSLEKVAHFTRALKIGAFLGLMIVVINVLVSTNGVSVLFEAEGVFFGSSLVLTKEALFFGLSMALKIIAVLSVIFLYDAAVSSDKAFSFFSRFFPSSTLMLVLTALMIPQLKKRFESVGLAMFFRGASLKDGGFLRRAKNASLLLKVLFITSLENSWQSAEALHARGYGCGPRTRFIKERWCGRSIVLLFAAAAAAVIWLGWLFSSRAEVQFYPSISLALSVADYFFYASLVLSLLSLPALCQRRLRWEA